MNRTALLVTAAFLPFALASDAEAGKKLKAESYLIRPTPAPDPDAKGRVRLDSENNKDKDRLEFKTENLDPLGSYSVFMEDGPASGVLVSIGAMVLDELSVGEFKLKFKENEGPLPLAAASVLDLVGRSVEIRDALSAVVLSGSVPDPSAQGGNGNGWKSKKAPLALPLVAVDPDAKGRVEVWFKGKDDRQRFRVKAELLTPAGVYSVEVEDAVGSGVFVAVGPLEVDESPEEFKLHIDTKQGEPLPLGVSNVDELAGRGVRIVDGSANVLLEGVVPDMFPN